MYFTLAKPFDNKQQNMFEFYNEISLLTIAYTLVPLTNSNLTMDAKYDVGWLIIGVTLGNLGANYTSMIVSMVIGIWGIIKKVVAKIKAKFAKKPLD